jgi:hypothetical protein
MPNQARRGLRAPAPIGNCRRGVVMSGEISGEMSGEMRLNFCCILEQIVYDTDPAARCAALPGVE